MTQTIFVGIFQNELVLYMLAQAHFIEYNEVLNIKELKPEKRLIGVLIIALQAVMLIQNHLSC